MEFDVKIQLQPWGVQSQIQFFLKVFYKTNYQFEILNEKNISNVPYHNCLGNVIVLSYFAK
jgi:hypothetical protein